MTFEGLTSTRERGSVVGKFVYTGNEVIGLNSDGVIPFPLVLESLCQCGIQAANNEPGLAKATFVVTYLLGTDFKRMAPVGRLGLRTEVSWSGKFGHVHAQARSGRKPVVAGEFGFAILGAG